MRAREMEVKIKSTITGAITSDAPVSVSLFDFRKNSCLILYQRPMLIPTLATVLHWLRSMLGV